MVTNRNIPKIAQIGWKHHVDFCVWKNRPLLLAKGVGHDLQVKVIEVTHTQLICMHIMQTAQNANLSFLNSEYYLGLRFTKTNKENFNFKHI